MAKSAALKPMVSCVPETKAVVRAVPLKLTTEAAMKPVPFTAKVWAPAPAVAEAGLRLLMVGTGLVAAGGFTVKVVAAVVPPPGAGLVTVTS